MSTIPESTRAANALIRAGAEANGYKAIISVRATRSARGYHAGRAEIYGPNGQGDRDYSIRRPRDKAGLSDASSAMDISFRGNGTVGSGAKARAAQRAFTSWLVARAKAGLADFQEVIGPGEGGRAFYHCKPNWTPIGPRPKGDSHEYHTHVGIPRDTEFSDRAEQFRAFFAAVPDPVPPTPDDPDEPPAEDPLQDELDAATARADAAEAEVARVTAGAAVAAAALGEVLPPAPPA